MTRRREQMIEMLEAGQWMRLDVSDEERARWKRPNIASGIAIGRHDWMLRYFDEGTDYNNEILRCQVEVKGDSLRTLGFVLFHVGAYRDATSRERTPTLETMRRHIDAFRNGDIIRYLVLLKAERLQRGER